MGGYTPQSYRSRKYERETFKHGIAAWNSLSVRQQYNVLQGLGWDV
jgi:hypothetical protein